MVSGYPLAAFALGSIVQRVPARIRAQPPAHSLLPHLSVGHQHWSCAYAYSPSAYVALLLLRARRAPMGESLAHGRPAEEKHTSGRPAVGSVSRRLLHRYKDDLVTEA